MIRAGKLLTNFASAKSASAMIPTRGMNVITPPRVRISFAEKVAHGVIMTVGMFAIPVYISVNIKNYRGDPEE